jgi:hypothetical protein
MHYLALDILLDLLVCIATLLQAVIKQSIVRLKDDYEVEESLGEEFAGVVVNNDTPLFHQLLKIVIDLQNAYVSPDRIHCRLLANGVQEYYSLAMQCRKSWTKPLYETAAN